MSAHKNEISIDIDDIIETERDILAELKETMKKPGISLTEKIKVSNSIAFHASVLSKLLTRRDAGDEFDESTLGDFVRGVEPRIARRIRSRYRTWTRRLSFRR